MTAYCALRRDNHPDEYRPAIARITVGIQPDPDAEDGFWESVELVCADCAEKWNST